MFKFTDFSYILASFLSSMDAIKSKETTCKGCLPLMLIYYFFYFQQFAFPPSLFYAPLYFVYSVLCLNHTLRWVQLQSFGGAEGQGKGSTQKDPRRKKEPFNPSFVLWDSVTSRFIWLRFKLALKKYHQEREEAKASPCQRWPSQIICSRL